MVCLAPLYSCVGRGYLAQPVAATPFGISSASLAAAMFGGWTAIWGGVIPGFVLALILGWCGAALLLFLSPSCSEYLLSFSPKPRPIVIQDGGRGAVCNGFCMSTFSNTPSRLAADVFKILSHPLHTTSLPRWNSNFFRQPPR